MGRRRKPRVAPATTATLRHQHGVAGTEHLADLCPGRGVADDGAGRNREDHVVSGGSGLVLSLPVDAALRLPGRPVAVVEQRGKVGIGGDEDVAAVPAIAAIGPALRHILEPGERRGARSAGAGGHLNLDLIDEVHHPIRSRSRSAIATAPPPASVPAAAMASVTSSTDAPACRAPLRCE